MNKFKNTLQNMAFAAAISLTACVTPDGTMAKTPEELARETARVIVKPIVAARFPGVPTDIAVDCVIDNASGSEIFQIAESAITGSPEQSTALVIPIIARPATLLCIASGVSGTDLNLGSFGEN